MALRVGADIIRSAFQAAVTRRATDDLLRNGYAVVDNLFGSTVSSRLREEVLGLEERMHANCTHFVSPTGLTTLVPKGAIREAELRDEVNPRGRIIRQRLDSHPLFIDRSKPHDLHALQAIKQAVPLCSHLQNDLTLCDILRSHSDKLALSTQAIKLQVNSGNGGAFPIHFDTDEGLDLRRVTCIIYLNPGWRPEDGGRLRLYPWPKASVDIDPINDRMVLFSSTRMLHRVLPSTARRVCFTIWMSKGAREGGAISAAEREAMVSGRRAASAALSRASLLGPDEALGLLTSPDIRPHAARLALAEEWAESLAQSHAESQERDALLQRFWKELEVIARALGPAVVAANLHQGGDWRKRAAMQRVQWF